MKLTTILVAALSLAFLSACDRGEPRPKTSAGTGSSATPATPAPSSANSGKVERNPVQGQVDPKENPQRKDFQTGGK
jgi:hypothetical protein